MCNGNAIIYKLSKPFSQIALRIPILCLQAARQFRAQHQQPEPHVGFGARDFRLNDPHYKMTDDFVVHRSNALPVTPPRQVICGCSTGDTS